MKTAILGAGRMGVWFAKFCKSKGDSVVVADRKKEKLAKLKSELSVETTTDFSKAARSADQVLICVSISAFEDVVKQIGPEIREGQTVLDICSIKEFPVRVMHQYVKNGLVLGTHPVFGPGSSGVKGKAFVLTPTNPKELKFAEEYKKWLVKEEARVFIMSPEKHDELMAMVLGFPHFVGLAACETLLEQANYPETKDVAGTTYRMLFTLAEATVLENPDLFASLQLSLPGMEKLEGAFIAKAQEWLNLIAKRDQRAIAARLEKVKTKLAKASPNVEKSYEAMYKMLEAAES